MSPATCNEENKKIYSITEGKRKHLNGCTFEVFIAVESTYAEEQGGQSHGPSLARQLLGGAQSHNLYESARSALALVGVQFSPY